MKIRRETEGETVVRLLEIEPFFADLLQRIVEDGNPGNDPAARARLFSAPVGDSRFREDWKEFVEPELHDLFRSAQETVASDLAGLPRARHNWTGPIEEFEEAAFTPSDCAVIIPRAHADAWLSALNQARLVIAARRGFDEADMEERLPLPPFNARQFEIFQIHFYDDLQQTLIQASGY